LKVTDYFLEKRYFKESKF